MVHIKDSLLIEKELPVSGLVVGVPELSVDMGTGIVQHPPLKTII